MQNRLQNYERTHGYDEYHFELDTIEHDPYVLISILSALHEGVFTIDQVQNDLNRLFGLQYILTETVETETRYRTETEIAQRPMRDPKTGKVLLDRQGQPIMEDYEVEVEVLYSWIGGATQEVKPSCLWCSLSEIRHPILPSSSTCLL